MLPDLDLEVRMLALSVDIEQKMERLKAHLTRLGSVLVAYSGGVDSTFLAMMASEVLQDKALAVTAASETCSGAALEKANQLARDLGLQHQVIERSELGIDSFAANPPERCYLCKSDLFTRLKAVAQTRGLAFVADGSTADDQKDYRPGRSAAQAAGIVSPLLETGFTKHEIRACLKHWNVPTWNQPANPCLASRIPYGDTITRKKLDQVQRAEQELRQMGFPECRVRHHGTIARIEVPLSDFTRLLTQREALVARIKQQGFDFVSLDLEGFRSGSLNVLLSDEVIQQHRERT